MIRSNVDSMIRSNVDSMIRSNVDSMIRSRVDSMIMRECGVCGSNAWSNIGKGRVSVSARSGVSGV